jgi:polyisoprenoid-binding protein YceI
VLQALVRRRTLAIGGAVIVAVVIVCAIAGAIYVFGAGGNNPAKTGDGTVTVPTLTASGDTTIFAIDSSSSKASFTIDEILFGKPNTVVGATDQVAGQIAINTKDPSQSKIGEIKVDVSTLTTDNPLRNRTLQGRILETDDPSNQYAAFVASSISGLPSSIAVGQEVSFKITGTLTVHGVTKTETFDATVKVVSEKQLTGQAQTTVKYSDFNISVPDVPSVTGLGETVKLAIDFTANAG